MVVAEARLENALGISQNWATSMGKSATQARGQRL